MSPYYCNIRSALLFLIIVLVASCDRFWHLEVVGHSGRQLDHSCIKDSVRAWASGADSVTIETFGVDTSGPHLVTFDVWPPKAGHGFQLHEFPHSDSVSVLFRETWVGEAPSADAVESKTGLFAGAIRRIGLGCGGKEPVITVKRPE